MSEAFKITLIGIGALWLFWAVSCLRTWQWGTYNPIEARAKAVFTAGLSLTLLACWLHWGVALGVLVLSFAGYFWAKRFFAGHHF